MLSMGIDPATLTGVAFYDTDRPEAAIITRTIQLPKKVSSEEKAYFAARGLVALIKANFVPEFVCVEESLKQAAPGKSVHPVIQGNMIAGSYLGALGLYKAACETVTPATWRKRPYLAQVAVRGGLRPIGRMQPKSIA